MAEQDVAITISVVEMALVAIVFSSSNQVNAIIKSYELISLRKKKAGRFGGLLKKETN